MYSLELPDGSHREHPPVDFGEAEAMVRAFDWKAVSGSVPGAGGESPFLLFLDQGESFFMIQPESGAFRITARVEDKWNLLGLMARQKSFTLDFGLLGLDDALVLLKLFFEDNYPALRALEREPGW
jgi:hypothetical protein